ncbi:MAG TPA: biotin/lipoyl-containing protein [Pseudonocardiaceae bacterium]|nr:biotin/lipoyl-containing protein [Pseudonocardiaceae bacterium]
MPQRLEQMIGPTDVSRSAEKTRETLREIRLNLGELLRETRRPARRVVIAVGEVSIEVEWPQTSDDVSQTDAGSPPATGGAADEPAGEKPAGELVRSPLVGTFYSAPEPGARPYVVAGDLVESGQQVGIIEAMKLMNPVEAPCRGRVVQVLAENGQAVEYDQPLLVLEPVGGVAGV